MFLPKYSAKVLKDRDSRLRVIQATLEECRVQYRRNGMAEAREPLLKLQDFFDKEGIDRLELLYLAEAAFPEDPYWLDAIVELLLRKVSLHSGETRMLLKKLRREPTNVILWHRLFRERRDDTDQAPFLEARRLCAIALLPYFGLAANRQWPDRVTWEDARHLFQRCLEDAVSTVLSTDQRDDTSRQLLEAAIELEPDRTDIQLRLADLIVERGERDSASIGQVLSAVLHHPGRRDLRRWAAQALLDLPGQHENGLGMLRQLHAEKPEEAGIEEILLSALKETDRIEEEDEELLSSWVAAHPGDLRALELLADLFAAQERLDEFALSIYRRASAHGPRRRVYLRMMGRSHAVRAEWHQVIQIFDRMRQDGENIEDLVIPLATAYSEFGRCDEEAAACYTRAIAQGSLNRKVHDLLCRHLYNTRPAEPASIARFSQSVNYVPNCIWARIGMAAHHLKTKDTARAAEQALFVIKEDPDNDEAIFLAARALAENVSRSQLALYANADPRALDRIFAEAYRLQPGAGPIAMAHVRRRLARGRYDEETARILGEVCRRNPDAVDLRIARADLLWTLGRQESAVAIYREIHERWSGATGTAMPRQFSPETGRHILFRLAEWVLRPPGPNPVDFPILMEAARETDAPAHFVVALARLVVDHGVEHPQKWFFVEQALRIEPEDEHLEWAMAEGMAAQGKPAQALRLAARHIESGRADERTVALLRSVQAFTTAGRIPEGQGTRLLGLVSRRPGLPPKLILTVMELLHRDGRRCTRESIPLLEGLLEAFPRNARVKHWMAQALSDGGEAGRAAALLGELMDESPDNDEVVLELARTHARLSAHSPGNLRVARSAVALEPEDSELLLHLAAIELEMGNFRSAARHMERILEDDPALHPRVFALLQAVAAEEHGDILVLLARVHMMAERVEQALEVLGRLQPRYRHYLSVMLDLYGDILSAIPDSIRARLGRAVLLRLAGRVDEAAQDLEIAHSLSPDNQEVLAAHVDVLNQKLNLRTPADPGLYIKVAEMELQLGDEEAAFELAHKAVRLSPQFDPALHLLARLHLLDGELAQCWESLQGLQDRAAALPLYQQLANAFADLGDHLKAAEVLTDALEVGGPQRELLRQLRQLHQREARTHKDSGDRQAIFGALSDAARGRYELREEIGSGSMGVVYKAHDRELDEIVVLKILPEHFANNGKALMRFRHEAKAARKLAHPNIVRIHDFGEEGGRKHISMEYVSGGDLKDHLRRNKGSLDRHRAIQIIRQVALALAHAHSEGILHRDIKAANILLTASGKAKLSDFGISAIIEEVNSEHAGPNSSRGVLGTPLYMAPEQFRGEKLTPATDLYAVGVLFHEMLAGSPPFTRGSISYHHQFTPPPRIEGISAELQGIVERLLCKDPAGRYQSAEDLIEAINLFAETGWSPIV